MLKIDYYKQELKFLEYKFGCHYRVQKNSHSYKREYTGHNLSIVYEINNLQEDIIHSLYIEKNGWKRIINILSELQNKKIKYSKIRYRLSKKYYFKIIGLLVSKFIDNDWFQ